MNTWVPVMWNVVISVFSMLKYFIVQAFKYIQLLCTQVQERLWLFHFSFCFLSVFFELLEESLFLAFRPSLCNMVFSALVESDASLQITATSVLTLLAQQTGERTQHSAVRNAASLWAWWTCPISQGCCWTPTSSWLWITWPGCCWRRRTTESGLFTLDVFSNVDRWCCSSEFEDRRMYGWFNGLGSKACLCVWFFQQSGGGGVCWRTSRAASCNLYH